ncbi:DNA-directed RNA polymerase V subunit 7-like [Dendrobium catenatum]|nr:DNA-directed RNA polymerase V subunit 7-like [Dendrobium catenatum]
MDDEVTVPYDVITSQNQTHQEIVFLDLYLKNTSENASKEYGYYISLATINPISNITLHQDISCIVFSVTFSYTTMKPCQGEILVGTVTEIHENGIVLQSGPLKTIFLSKNRMEDYEFNLSNEPMFLKVKGSSYIKEGTKVRFRVLDVKWIRREEAFNIEATILGDYLGPI